MIVRLIQQMSGPRYDGQPWPAYGETIEVADWEGRELCAAGIAVPAQESAVQTADAPADPKVEVRAGPAAEVRAEPAAEAKAEASASLPPRPSSAVPDSPVKRGPGRPPKNGT